MLGVFVLLVHGFARSRQDVVDTEVKISTSEKTLVPSLVDIFAHLPRHTNTSEFDLEMTLPTKYMDDIHSKIFLELGAFRLLAGRTVESDEIPKLDFVDVYQALKLLEELPPIRRLTEAKERWDSFAGGDSHKHLTANILISAYREVFGATLPLEEAQNMIKSLVVNGKPDDSPKIGKCEFMLGSLYRGYLSDTVTAGYQKLYSKRDFWTMKDLMFELGYCEDDDFPNFLDNLVFEIDVPIAPSETRRRELEAEFLTRYRHVTKEEMPSHFFTLCETKLFLGITRNNRFRGFFDLEPPKVVQHSPDHEFEEFLGVQLYPHSTEELVVLREEKSKLLKDFFDACDLDGDNRLTKSELSILLLGIDIWQDLVEPFDELMSNGKTPNIVQGFPIEKLYAPHKYLKLNRFEKENFEKVWAQLAGPKAHWIPQQKWIDYMRRVANRGKHKQISNDQEYTMHQIHFETPNELFEPKSEIHSYGRLYKTEVMNAWMGQPTLLQRLTKSVVKDAFLVLDPTGAEQCNRKLWTILFPMMHVFWNLDESDDGFITLQEFRSLKDWMPRLQKKPALSDDHQIEGLYNKLLKDAGTRKFQFSAFARIFLGQNGVSMATFLDPPELEKSYGSESNAKQ